jgi:hypothetical protein
LEVDEEVMVKRRRRFKQTTSLAQRLTQEASRLRERARSLSPGPEQAQLWRKVRQAETALRIDAWLALPQDTPPGEVAPFMQGNQQENQRKRRKPSRATAHNGDDAHSR